MIERANKKKKKLLKIMQSSLMKIGLDNINFVEQLILMKMSIFKTQTNQFVKGCHLLNDNIWVHIEE